MSETKVICLKGRLNEFGPALEHTPYIVYVGRACYQGKWRLPRSAWANPFSVQKMGGARAAVDAYREWLLAPEQDGLRARIIPELRGRTLGCWCRITGPNTPCHALLLARWCDHGIPRTQAAEPGVLPLSRHIHTATVTGAWAGAL